jgi:hypothetical protein
MGQSLPKRCELLCFAKPARLTTRSSNTKENTMQQLWLVAVRSPQFKLSSLLSAHVTFDEQVLHYQAISVHNNDKFRLTTVPE